MWRHARAQLRCMDGKDYQLKDAPFFFFFLDQTPVNRLSILKSEILH